MPSLKQYLKKIHGYHLSHHSPITSKRVLAFLCQDFCAHHKFKPSFFNQESAQFHYLLAQQLHREISKGGDFLIILKRQLDQVNLDKESDFYSLLKAFFYFYYESYRALDNRARHKFALEFDNLPVEDADITRLLKVFDSNASGKLTVQVINLLSILCNRLKPETQKNIKTKLLRLLASTETEIKGAATRALTKLAPLPFADYKNEIVISLREALFSPVFAESHIECLMNIVSDASENLIKTVFNTILARYSRLLREPKIESLFRALCKIDFDKMNVPTLKDWLILKVLDQLIIFDKTEPYQNLYNPHFKLFRHFAFLASPELASTVTSYCINIIRNDSNKELSNDAFCVLSQIQYNFSIEEMKLIYQYISISLAGFSLGVNHAISRWIHRFTHDERLKLLQAFFDNHFIQTDEALAHYMPVLGELIRNNNALFLEIAKQHLGINFQRQHHWRVSNSMLVKASEFIAEPYKKSLNALIWEHLFNPDGSSNFNVSYDFRYIMKFFPQEIIHDNLTRLAPYLLTKVEEHGLLDALFVKTLLASTESHALNVLKSITEQYNCDKLRSSFQEILRKTSSAEIKRHLTQYCYQKSLVDVSWVYWLCSDYSVEQTRISDEMELLVLQKDFALHAPYLALFTLRAYNDYHFNKKYNRSASKLDNIVSIVISFAKRSNLRMRHLAGSLLSLFADKLTDHKIKTIINKVIAELFVLKKAIALDSVRIITSLSSASFQRETLSEWNMALVVKLLEMLNDPAQLELQDVSYAALFGLCPVMAMAPNAVEYNKVCFDKLTMLAISDEHIQSERAHKIIIKLLENSPAETRFQAINHLLSFDWARPGIISHRELWLAFMRNITIDERNYFFYGTVLDLVDRYRTDDAKFVDVLELVVQAEQEIQCRITLSASVNDVEPVSQLILDYARLAI